MAEETGASAPYQQESSKSNVVYLGIDLGTANSSICHEYEHQTYGSLCRGVAERPDLV
jgi:hypothetical protein